MADDELKISSDSLSKVALNNYIVAMRNNVLRAKVQTVHKLTRTIKSLRQKKGTEEQKKKNNQKADRLVEEILLIKNMNKDNISKACLENTMKLDDILADSSAPTVKKAWARVSKHESIAKAVAKFRDKYPDWKEAVPRILNFTKKEQRAILRREKRKIDNLNKNKKASADVRISEAGEETDEGEETVEGENMKEGGEDEIIPCILNHDNNENISEHVPVVKYKGNTFKVELISDLSASKKKTCREKTTGKRQEEESTTLVSNSADKLSKNVSSLVQSNSEGEEDSGSENDSRSDDEIPTNMHTSPKVRQIEENLVAPEENHVDPFFVTRDNKEYYSYAPVAPIAETDEKNIRAKYTFKDEKFNKNKFPSKTGGFEKRNWKQKDFSRGNKFNERRINSQYQPNNFINKENKKNTKTIFKVNDSLENKQEEILHPSWQAKKKLSTIPVFEGKKINFDD